MYVQSSTHNTQTALNRLGSGKAGSLPPCLMPRYNINGIHPHLKAVRASFNTTCNLSLHMLSMKDTCDHTPQLFINYLMIGK